LFFLFKTSSHYIAQTGLELFHPSASASHSAGITSVATLLAPFKDEEAKHGGARL
jgi:hypothetical protein